MAVSPCRKLRWYEPVVEKFCCVGVGIAGAFRGYGSGQRKATQAQKEAGPGANPLANVNSKQPDKALFDKAMVAMKKGRYDVARLDLQTMLNTYPDSEYRMRAKLAVGDSWFKEGGTAALTQAESEYKDFITFFPDAPEAAEAQMKVGDIYYQQMEKPDRDYNNAQDAEKEYRTMINMFPDSPLIPRAKQKLRDVQEVLAERETQIGLYYEAKENYPASIARLETVVDTYPLYSKSDQALIAIGDAYAGEAHTVMIAPNLNGAVRERLHSLYQDKAAAAYAKVITRYPMAPHVEDARDRLVAMNRPVPEPTDAAVAENDAEVKSQQPIRFTDTYDGHHQARSHGGGSGARRRAVAGRSEAHPGARRDQTEHRTLQRGGRQARGNSRGEADRAKRAATQRCAVNGAACTSWDGGNRRGRLDCECAEW